MNWKFEMGNPFWESVVIIVRAFLIRKEAFAQYWDRIGWCYITNTRVWDQIYWIGVKVEIETKNLSCQHITRTQTDSQGKRYILENYFKSVKTSVAIKIKYVIAGFKYCEYDVPWLLRWLFGVPYGNARLQRRQHTELLQTVFKKIYFAVYVWSINGFVLSYFENCFVISSIT